MYDRSGYTGSVKYSLRIWCFFYGNILDIDLPFFIYFSASFLCRRHYIHHTRWVLWDPIVHIKSIKTGYKETIVALIVTIFTKSLAWDGKNHSRVKCGILYQTILFSTDTSFFKNLQKNHSTGHLTSWVHGLQCS